MLTLTCNAYVCTYTFASEFFAFVCTCLQPSCAVLRSGMKPTQQTYHRDSCCMVLRLDAPLQRCANALYHPSIGMTSVVPFMPAVALCWKSNLYRLAYLGALRDSQTD